MRIHALKLAGAGPTDVEIRSVGFGGFGEAENLARAGGGHLRGEEAVAEAVRGDVRAEGGPVPF